MTTPTQRPTHEQAQLQLQIFEMRREEKLRKAREWFFKECFADNLDEAMRIAPPGSEAGNYFMMVASYWEQACALLNYGLLYEDLFFETNEEFFGVWERIKPCIKEARERFGNKQFLTNMEQAAQRYEQWIESRSPGFMNAMRQHMQQMRAQSKKAA
ncbi:MAG: hypothetical protein CXZ00_13400 [Acidobacteria bacterium]|nr:MAG: hypothetical protein CXZ00_13400 [Acidobacteriota bacterium]